MFTSYKLVPLLTGSSLLAALIVGSIGVPANAVVDPTTTTVTVKQETEPVHFDIGNGVTAA